MGIIKRFIGTEAFSGFLLMFVTLLALICENSALHTWYQAFLHFAIELNVAGMHLHVGSVHFINDALMVVFFLLVGLEIKREMVSGHLASRAQLFLPLLSAIGGMLAPALIFVLFNLGSPDQLRGWAIPSATDIAFALGVLSLLGKRVPLALKVFLTALAIIDDMGAVLVIAFFYTNAVNVWALFGALVVLGLLAALNRSNVTWLMPYMLLGVLLWAAVLMSGIHATIAGVLLALTIPLGARGDTHSPLHRLEHALHPWVAYAIMPLFAFANAGLNLSGLELSALLAPVPLGIALGLFVGKQIGVMGFALLAVRLGLARLPTGASWRQFYGVSILTGIGFTMSLFIGLLAFQDPELIRETRLGVLSGSLIAAVFGYVCLRIVSGPSEASSQPTSAASPS